MAIAYDWQFKFDAALSESGLQNVVKAIRWVLTAKDGAFVETISGVLPMAEPDPEDFKPFEELTEEQVYTWLETLMDAQGFKDELAAKIEKRKTPTTAQLDAPWLKKK